MKTAISFGLVSLALLLSACAEKAQTSGTQKTDSKPWEGAQTGYVASGWKAGDQASWEEQMKVRSQGQNEYSRAPAKP